MTGPSVTTPEKRYTRPLQKQCTRCKGVEFRRVNRVHLLERTLLTWLGFFPWECVLCRRRAYFRNDGHRPRSRPERA